LGTGSRLDAHAERLADAAAAALDVPAADAARGLVPAADRTATVVVAHELIRELTRRLTAAGDCPPPRALAEAPADPAALTELLFLTRSAPR
ncbi:hypothetical protein, partial [Streptomyces mayteni]